MRSWKGKANVRVGTSTSSRARPAQTVGRGTHRITRPALGCRQGMCNWGQDGRLLEDRSFNLYIGFLYAIGSGRPTLALDQPEESSGAVVDRFVHRIYKRRQLVLKDLEEDLDRRGILLTRDGQKKFCRARERYMYSPMAAMAPGSTSGGSSIEAGEPTRSTRLGCAVSTATTSTMPGASGDHWNAGGIQ